MYIYYIENYNFCLNFAFKIGSLKNNSTNVKFDDDQNKKKNPFSLYLERPNPCIIIYFHVKLKLGYKFYN